MPTPELLIVIQGLLTALCGVLWYMFIEVKKKADKNAEDLLLYKNYVSQTYVTDSQLTKVLEALNQNLQSVLHTVARVEERLYQKEQNGN